MDAAPAAEDGLSKAAADGVSEDHAHKGREAWRSPCRHVKKGNGQGCARATAKVCEEARGGPPEGAKDAHGENNKAHARR